MIASNNAYSNENLCWGNDLLGTNIWNCMLKGRTHFLDVGTRFSFSTFSYFFFTPLFLVLICLLVLIFLLLLLPLLLLADTRLSQDLAAVASHLKPNAAH